MRNILKCDFTVLISGEAACIFKENIPLVEKLRSFGFTNDEIYLESVDDWDDDDWDDGDDERYLCLEISSERYPDLVHAVRHFAIEDIPYLWFKNDIGIYWVRWPVARPKYLSPYTIFWTGFDEPEHSGS